MQTGLKEIPQQEIAVIKGQTTKALSAANSLAIKTDEDLNGAAVLLKRMHDVGILIKNTKDSITRPINEAVQNVRELFRPIESNFKLAETTVKEKILDYEQKKSIGAEAKKEKIEEKVENGEIGFKEGAEKMEKIDRPNQVGDVHFRVIREVVIEDESKLPREYLVPDTGKIRRDALGGKDIPGVKVTEKKTTVVT